MTDKQSVILETKQAIHVLRPSTEKNMDTTATRNHRQPFQFKTQLHPQMQRPVWQNYFRCYAIANHKVLENLFHE